MDISGEFRIPAPRQKVWEALNDPDVLGQCIPGCESIHKDSDTEFSARIRAAVGPVKSKFDTRITLTELNPPESYTISGQAKSGAAGFAKGGADVKLEEDGEETVLRYTARVQPGGKLAQVGSRLMDSTARKLSNEFFTSFAATLAPQAAGEPSESGEAAGEPEAPAGAERAGGSERPAGTGRVAWGAGVAVLVIVVVLWLAASG